MSAEPKIFAVQDKNHDDKPFELDDAISLTRHGRFHYLVLLASGCCLLTVVTETLGISFILPSAQCDLHLTTQDKGMVGAICFIGMIASSHLWGFLADTIGRRKILVFTLLMDGVATIICSFAHSVWLLLLCRFFNGFFVCGPSAVVYAYLGEFNSAETRTKAIVLACGFVSFSFILMPGLAWLIIPGSWSWELPLYSYKPWRLFMLICGIPSLLTAALLAFTLPETPKFLIEQRKEEEALGVLRRMFTFNTGKSADDYPVKSLTMAECGNENQLTTAPSGKSLCQMVKVVWDQTWPLFLPPYLSKTIMGCTLEFGIYASANGFVLWLPEIFARMADHALRYPDSDATVCQKLTAVLDKNVTLNSTSIIEECNLNVDSSVYINTLINGVAIGLAFIFGGFLVNVIGKRILLPCSLFISGLAAMAIYFVQLSTHVLALSSIFSSLTGMSISIVTSIVVDAFPTHLRAMAVCIALMMGRLGTAVASVFIGALIEINCASVFFVQGGIIIGCTLLALVFTMPNKQIPVILRPGQL